MPQFGANYNNTNRGVNKIGDTKCILWQKLYEYNQHHIECANLSFLFSFAKFLM